MPSYFTKNVNGKEITYDISDPYPIDKDVVCPVCEENRNINQRQFDVLRINHTCEMYSQELHLKCLSCNTRFLVTVRPINK